MSTMLRLRSCLSVAALALASAGAAAQAGATAKLYCHVVGNGAPEALGDREGHAVSAGTLSCRIEGGPMDGGVLTGTSIFEWDKGQAVLLSGSGVVRKPGAYSAFQTIEGKQALVMTDGKVTGMTGSGRGRHTLATGTAAAMSGRSYSFSYSSSGPGQLVIDVKYE